MDALTFADDTWVLTTPATTYALRVAPDGVRNVYWGPRLPVPDAAALPMRPPVADDVLGDELPGEGDQRFGPPSLRLVFADGSRTVEWAYRDHTVDHTDTGDTLAVRLAGQLHPIELTLHYRVRGDSDVIERWATLANTGTEPLTVERFDSACWTLPARLDYRLSSVAGEWAAEFQVQRVPLGHGEVTLASRRGTTRHQSNPWLMVDPGDATEESGEVWSVALAWSGTWRLTTRRTFGDDVTVTAGAGHDGTARRLRAGESLTTPVCAGLYAAGGFGATSRAWHEHTRRYVLPHGDELRPVLYNSWEGTWFDVDERGQKELAAIAAELGAELYVMDDGWFGERASDNAALGDWWPNPVKFPDGLTPLIDEVHRLGMRFGLWVEPEMVNPDSDLYRAHPDWVLHQTDRRRTEIRNQLVLNFARPDVVDWAAGWLDELLSRHAIDFLKWDMNRAFTEAGWPGDEDPQRLWFGHTEGVYAVLDRLRAAHPHVRVETCASGGGRVDLGILRRTDQAWTSDNTDPVDRLAIQYGYGQVYPAMTMGAWASESPNPLHARVTPVRFRMHVAMAGALGISGHLRHWSTQDRAEAAALVARYKQIRHVVQHGVLYRPAPPDRATTVVQYVSADGAEAVLFVWRPSVVRGPAPRPIRLGGLSPDATYDVAGQAYSGAVLTRHGLTVTLPGHDFASEIVHLRRT